MKENEKLMNKIASKLLKTIAIMAVLMYASLTIISQEADFNKYDNDIAQCKRQKEEEELKNEQLMNIKAKISSNEYIEEIAREKLGLVMPNEIVFVDANL